MELWMASLRRYSNTSLALESIVGFTTDVWVV